MFFNFVVFLAILSVVFSHDKVHTNDKKAARAMTRILSRHSSAPKAAAVAKSHSQQKEVQRTVTGQEIWTGYFTERSRPNADCSGVVTQMFGIALGTCWTTPTGGSYKYGCESSGRNVELKAQSYFSNDCSGSPNGLAINGEFSGDQCHMNLDNVNKTGFEMIGLACESNPMSHLDHSGGLKTFHFDSQCMDAPYQYVIMRGDACMLDMDTGDGDMLTDESEFTYIMYTDGNDNAIEVTGFSDSSCRRPLWRGWVPNSDIGTDGVCRPDGEGYSKFVGTGGQEPQR